MSTFMERKRAELAARGIDPARLPPGQYVTERFPLLHLGPVPSGGREHWSLRLGGDAAGVARTLGRAELEALGAVEVTTDIHCVTKWSRLDVTWTGVRLRDVLTLAAPDPLATTLLAVGANHYSASLTLSDLHDRHDALVAWAVDGAPLTDDHGGPLRLVVPHRYFWKSVKWLGALELWREPVLGFWERNGYHHRGDPFAEERHWGDDAPGAPPMSGRDEAGREEAGGGRSGAPGSGGDVLPRPLRDLLERVLAEPAPDLPADVTRLRSALEIALVRVLGGGRRAWPDLVAAAAERGGWDRWRIAGLLDAAHPADDAQPEVTRDVLADVAEELISRGTLRRGPWEGAARQARTSDPYWTRGRMHREAVFALERLPEHLGNADADAISGLAAMLSAQIDGLAPGAGAALEHAATRLREGAPVDELRPGLAAALAHTPFGAAIAVPGAPVPVPPGDGHNAPEIEDP
jgi:DMSO/TMAO reductase YedYZ molybdopterin-dependent catalytic subunit